MKDNKELLKLISEIDVDSLSNDELVKTIGRHIADIIGETDVASIGLEWAKNVLSNKTAEYAKVTSELVAQMAGINKTQKELTIIRNGLSEIVMDEILESEATPEVLDDLLFQNSERMLNTLRNDLEAGHGVLISDTIESPMRLPDGTLGQNSAYSGAILFGIPEKDGEFSIKSFVPAISNRLILAEAHGFEIPTELLLLSFNNKEDVKIRFTSIDQDGELKEEESGIYGINAIEKLDFHSNKESKIEELTRIIKERETFGYKLKGLKIVERPESFNNVNRNEIIKTYATSISGIFYKEGATLNLGDEAIDTIQVEGWRFDEEEVDSDKMKSNPVIYNKGWELKSLKMNEAISKLEEFTKLNIDEYIKKQQK